MKGKCYSPDHIWKSVWESLKLFKHLLDFMETREIVLEVQKWMFPLESGYGSTALCYASFRADVSLFNILQDIFLAKLNCTVDCITHFRIHKDVEKLLWSYTRQIKPFTLQYCLNMRSLQVWSSIIINDSVRPCELSILESLATPDWYIFETVVVDQTLENKSYNTRKGRESLQVSASSFLNRIS